MMGVLLSTSSVEERRQMNDKGLSDLVFGYLPNDVNCKRGSLVRSMCAASL